MIVMQDDQIYENKNDFKFLNQISPKLTSWRYLNVKCYSLYANKIDSSVFCIFFKIKLIKAFLAKNSMLKACSRTNLMHT